MTKESFKLGPGGKMTPKAEFDKAESKSKEDAKKANAASEEKKGEIEGEKGQEDKKEAEKTSKK